MAFVPVVKQFHMWLASSGLELHWTLATISQLGCMVTQWRCWVLWGETGQGTKEVCYQYQRGRLELWACGRWFLGGSPND